ncbi:MAG: dephospho-CoA kinase [Actinobacteria bacterium]|nr:MAG: dephospho-CoA kinase [Actinomycetota bacterium]TMM21070.1 MAG: dephospho-CoA kinase [Actinomycetota bacterium]
MLLVGLTGGIGSGKSTVADLLRKRGAVVLDADDFARAAVVAGSVGLRKVAERFGREVLGPDGELDRRKLASIVFADPAALSDLEAIVHPEVRRMFADGIQENLDGQRVVVLVNPLLIEMGTHRDCDIVVVVSASIDTQIARSVARGMDESDVRARIAAQLPLAERAQAADVLIDNEGTLDELEDEVDVLWHQLQDRAAAPV